MKTLKYSDTKYLNGKRQINTFIRPEDYVLHFPIIKFCKVCKKPSFTRKISVFDNKCVFVCKHCGCRHTITRTRILSKTLFTVVLALLLIFCAVNAFAGNIDINPQPPVSYEEKVYKDLSKNGIYITESDKIYVDDHSFDAKTVGHAAGNYNPIDYYYDKDGNVLWLEFSGKQGDETLVLWYPYEL